MRVDLSSAKLKWQMSFAKDAEISEKTPAGAAEMLKSSYPVYEARIPGNFEIDLQRNGIIDDPFLGLNVLKVHEYEDCHVWYFTSFAIEAPAGGDSFLVFEGLDTFADIYLNGQRLVSTDNMLIEHRIPVNGKLKSTNELLVHIKPACIEAKKYDYTASNFALNYNYESLFVRKAPHMYGWDIMPRIVSAGIWRDVYIENLAYERIEECYLQTVSAEGENGDAKLSAFFKITMGSCLYTDYELTIEGCCRDRSFKVRRKLHFCAGSFSFTAGNVKLWWPKGRGEPNLYSVTVSLMKGGQSISSREFNFGIRTVKLERTGVIDGFGNGEFYFIVNGEKVFIKGSNWVPADALHSRDRERIPKIMEYVGDIGCNMLRCWGGNVYEDNLFYDLCDASGIMVWQDFAMACAVYPHSEEFQSRLKAEAESVVKRLRQHPCIVLWAGDNECDAAHSWRSASSDPNTNILTRRILPDAIMMHDSNRPFLPSSPYMDEEAFKKGGEYTLENHLWGPRDYYKSRYYTQALCRFASEMGYHGCPGPDSVKKFISPDKLWPYNENDEWMLHATAPKLDEDGQYNYRIGLMANQIKEMFGFIPDNLDDFALASQISQAEAFKFFIELFRSQKWKKTGIIWWNLIDGWPQFSDAVMDYYFGKKLAYEYIKRAQQPFCILVKEPENWANEVVASNDTREPLEVEYSIADADSGAIVLEGQATVKADSVARLGEIPFSHSDRKFYLIHWKSGLGSGKSHYLSGMPTFDFNKYQNWMKKAGYTG